MTATKIPATMKRFVLARRSVGMPVEDDFRLEEVPTPRPKDGELLIRAKYISVDPFQRSRIEAATRYGKPMPLNETVLGRMVGEIVLSRHPNYREGQIVHGMLGWQEYAISDGGTNIENYGPGITVVDPDLAPISTALGIMGMPGATAYFAVTNIANPKPGEIVLVSSAAGAVGSTIGQIVKVYGCRVYGLAGSQEKVDFLTSQLGFDGALNYRASRDLATDIGRLCPDGIDIYFDLVGGEMRHAVLEHLRPFARIPLVGFISQVNDRPPSLPDPTRVLMAKRVRMEGLIVYDHVGRMDEFRSQMSHWIKTGKVRPVETIVEGFERLPRAFIEMLQGKNVGKYLVRV